MNKTSLGIDCSARATGLVILTSERKYNFTLIAPQKLREGARLDRIYSAMEEFLSGESIDLAVMETPSFRSTNKPFTIGEVHGVIKLLLVRRGIPLVGVAPKALKKYATGKGTSSKEEVYEAMREQGCPIRQFDISDAWAASLVGLDALLDECSPGTRAAYEVVHHIKESSRA